MAHLCQPCQARKQSTDHAETLSPVTDPLASIGAQEHRGRPPRDRSEEPPEAP